MPPSTAIPIKASTQEHLDIFDIRDDLVISKDGSTSLLLQVTAINFGLLSEGEQDAIIYAYASLLNSLNFPIQISVQSKIKDITDYIRLVRKQETKQRNPLLLNQLKKYREFVEATVSENQVQDKKFYVSIPFTTLEMGLTSSVTGGFKKKPQQPPYPIPQILERAKFNLYPKRDHLIRQFGRIGLQCRQLNTQQLIELFYNFYNRENVGSNLADSQSYSRPMVSPAPRQANAINQLQRQHQPAPQKVTMTNTTNPIVQQQQAPQITKQPQQMAKAPAVVNKTAFPKQ